MSAGELERRGTTNNRWAEAIHSAWADRAVIPPTDDCELEIVLEAVLWRWGIPTDVGTPHALNARADRGDLASDLADAARRVLRPISDTRPL